MTYMTFQNQGTYLLRQIKGNAGWNTILAFQMQNETRYTKQKYNFKVLI